jgi:hypothetical protein
MTMTWCIPMRALVDTDKTVSLVKARKGSSVPVHCPTPHQHPNHETILHKTRSQMPTAIKQPDSQHQTTTQSCHTSRDQSHIIREERQSTVLLTLNKHQDNGPHPNNNPHSTTMRAAVILYPTTNTNTTHSDSHEDGHTADAVREQIQKSQPGQVAHWIEWAWDCPTTHAHRNHPTRSACMHHQTKNDMSRYNTKATIRIARPCDAILRRNITGVYCHDTPTRLAFTLQHHHHHSNSRNAGRTAYCI